MRDKHAEVVLKIGSKPSYFSYFGYESNKIFFKYRNKKLESKYRFQTNNKKLRIKLCFVREFVFLKYLCVCSMQ